MEYLVFHCFFNKIVEKRSSNFSPLIPNRRSGNVSLKHIPRGMISARNPMTRFSTNDSGQKRVKNYDYVLHQTKERVASPNAIDGTKCSMRETRYLRADRQNRESSRASSVSLCPSRRFSSQIFQRWVGGEGN